MIKNICIKTAMALFVLVVGILLIENTNGYADSTTPTAILYSNNTLVFQIGDVVDASLGRVSKTYTGFLTEEYTSASDVPWYEERQSIRSIVVKDTMSPVSTAYWFFNMWRCFDVDIEKLDTSNVTNMRCMFADFYGGASSLDVSHFDTSNVTDMSGMFRNWSNLTSIDVSGFDTRNVTDMSYMFSGCRSVTEIDVSGFDTSKVTNMSSMFDSCRAVSELDVSHFDTSNVTNMSGMFRSCKLVSEIDVSGFDTSKVTNMAEMFYECSEVSTIDVSGFVTSEVTSVVRMFYDCSSITSLNLTYFDTSKLTALMQCFHGCSSLQYLDVSNWDVSRVKYFEDMFRDCSSLLSLDLSRWDTSSNVGDADYMFENCRSLKKVDLSGWNFVVKSGGDVRNMFNGCTNLEEIDIPGFDTRRAAYLQHMFDGCSSLKRVMLGNQFSFKGYYSSITNYHAILPTPPSGITTGKWIREDEEYGPYTPEELKANYNSAKAGVWVWQELSFTVEFTVPDGESSKYGGSMPRIVYRPITNEALPLNAFYRNGYVFDHWEDEQGNIYTDGSVIPFGRYNDGDNVVLVAKFNFVVSSEVSHDGSIEFDLKSDHAISLSGIAGNTIYQIWEETPDGWQLVQAGNTSDSIPSERTATVAYRNNYNPELAQVTLVGQKRVIDSSGVTLYPAKNQYTFTLTETTGDSSALLQEIGNSDSGIVRFDPIELDSVGIHTYEIREIAGGNSHMDYDDHIEIVTVRVTDNGSGLLTSEIITDSDGIVFTNYLNDRGSLKLTKMAKDETGSFHWNEGETFSFNITFRDKYDSIPSGVCSTYLSNEALNKGWTYNSTTGVMTVVLNENKQSVVIENIPYGLKYSVQENLSDSSLYELTNVTGNTGVISETQSEAVFTNTFKIVLTSIMLMAYKTADFDIENDEFTFELLDSDMNVIQSVTNGSVVSDGMNSGKAPVLFDSIPVTSDGTFTYYIREVVGNDAGIEYDDQLIKCEVNVVNEHGYLRADVIYSLQD